MNKLHESPQKKLLLTACLSFLIAVPQLVLGLEQREKVWLGINIQQNFSVNNKWFYTFYTQWRFENESHPWESTLFEGGLGYSLDAAKSLWLGSRVTFHTPNHDFYTLYRLIQQLNWTFINSNSYNLVSRTRLEEEKRSNQSPVSFQIRERLAVELKYFFGQRINPYFYDEIFFQLNKTSFTSNKLITQNRLLLGFNYYLSQERWLEIGYLNQFQWRRPSWIENRMSHILSITYNFL